MNELAYKDLVTKDVYTREEFFLMRLDDPEITVVNDNDDVTASEDTSNTRKMT